MIVIRTRLATLVGRWARLFAVRKDSQWIYSSQSQEMMNSRSGTLTLSALPAHHHDTTLRLHRSIRNAHIILTACPTSSSQLLQKLELGSIPKQEQGLVAVEQSLVEMGQLRPKGVTQALQLSKQLQFAIQNQKIDQSNSDRDHKWLKQQQGKLIQFMEQSRFKDQLISFRDRNRGWPTVVPFDQNIKHIEKWKTSGINILCLLQESNVLSSQSLFKHLHQIAMPYQILPTSHSIINTLAASGFPADRFAIEYFPQNSNFLAKRASMKMTIGIAIQGDKLKQLLLDIIVILGPSHLVYIENSKGKMVGRGPIKELSQGIQCQQEEYRVVVAPYLSTFNQELKEERNKVAQIYGQAMYENTHFVRIQFLDKQLKNMLKSNENKETLILTILQKMILAKMQLTIIANILSEISPYSRKQIIQLGEQVRRHMVQDHLGLQELVNKK